MILRHCYSILKNTVSNSEFPIIPNVIDAKSSEFIKNSQDFLKESQTITNLIDQAKKGGEEEARKRHVQRGKLLTRDRINLLLDRETEFYEFSTLAAHEVYPDESVPSAGLVTGIGNKHIYG
jgi:3-methylcrotonyl-CoA carboxylase beta subunit